jgi:hypothetical protein
MSSDTNGWEIIRHPDESGLRSLAHDEGGCLVCYDEGPLNPAQMRNLAAALLRAADEAEGPTLGFDPLKYDEDEARGNLERALPGGYIVGDAGGLILSEDALNSYRDAVEARVRRTLTP